jgi:hypothetical protein
VFSLPSIEPALFPCRLYRSLAFFFPQRCDPAFFVGPRPFLFEVVLILLPSRHFVLRVPLCMFPAATSMHVMGSLTLAGGHSSRSSVLGAISGPLAARRSERLGLYVVRSFRRKLVHSLTAAIILASIDCDDRCLATHFARACVHVPAAHPRALMLIGSKATRLELGHVSSEFRICRSWRRYIGSYGCWTALLPRMQASHAIPSRNPNGPSS